MTIDPRAMVKRHAAWLVLGAVAVLAIVLALCGAVAHAQGLEHVPPHAVDGISALVGGGGVTGLGLLLLSLVALGNRLGLSLPRIVIGGKEPAPTRPADDEATAPARAPIHPDVVAQLQELRAERDLDRQRLDALESCTMRIELGVKEVRDQAQQIMFRLMRRGP